MVLQPHITAYANTCWWTLKILQCHLWCTGTTKYTCTYKNALKMILQNITVDLWRKSILLSHHHNTHNVLHKNLHNRTTGHIYHRSLCLNSTRESSLWRSHSNHRRWQWRSLLPRTIPPNKCIAAILRPQRSKGRIQNHRHPNSSLACFCQTQTYCHTELKYRFLLHKWYNTIINLQSIDLPGVTAPTIQYSIRIIDMPLIQYYSLIKNLLKTLKGIWYINCTS